MSWKRTFWWGNSQKVSICQRSVCGWDLFGLQLSETDSDFKILYMHIYAYAYRVLECHVEQLTVPRKHGRIRPQDEWDSRANGQAATALLSSEWIASVVHPTVLKPRFPVLGGLLQHASSLATEGQGPLTNSPSRAAFLTEMSKLCFGKRQWAGKNKLALHSARVHFWRESKSRHGRWQAAWIHSSSRKWSIFTSHPLSAFRNQAFAEGYYQHRRTLHQTRGVFYQWERMWQGRFTSYSHIS